MAAPKVKSKKDACYYKVKARYKVWPSVHTLQVLWLNVERLVQLTGATVKRRSDMGNVRKTEAGANLQRWFKEKWVDVRTGKPCGRQKGESRAYPYCRPSMRVCPKPQNSQRTHGF